MAPLETITAVTALPRDPNSRDVHIGDRVVARLRAVDVDALGLAIGVAWTPDLAGAVADTIAMETARRAALALLARRGLTAAETIDRLEAKDHAPDTARRIVVELTEQGWLDDAAVARDTATHVLRKGPAAVAHVQRRIEARGIEPSLAARVAEEATAGVDPVEAALTMARTRRASTAAPTATEARRLAAALARRGFDEDTIRTALDRLGVRGRREA